ncbi:hypothetical protein BU15DRAFT_71394 [Melanogaster broomeanus]|nr:hypothetical protein BU15DRAFT_71394 [Melanogaster broomeanus]
MTYNFYRTSLPGWGTNRFGIPEPIQFQPQPYWRGVDFFRAHAAAADPTLFHQVYGTISGANGSLAPLGVGLNEARMWHQKAYGSIGMATTLSPQEIGHAAAYEAYLLWIYNNGLYEPLGGEMGREREALIGLAVAEATGLCSVARPTAPYAQLSACETAAATASLLFQENLAFGGQGYGMHTARYSGMRTYPSSPGRYGTMGTVDPYAIDYDAPYFRWRMGLRPQRRLSLPGPGAVIASPGYSSGMYNDSSYGPGSGVRGTYGFTGSPYLGSAGTVMHAPASPIAPVPNSPMPRVTTVPTASGQSTTIIELPKRHHHSSNGHHRSGRHHHHQRSRSADPFTTTTIGGGFGNVASGAARAVGGLAGGIAGGATGLVGGAVGGLARGAIGGASSAMGVPRPSSYWGYPGSLGTAYPGSVPGYGGIYRYH